jgi:hypothetical protein
MPTLRRILKYTPAIVMGLLLLLWFDSLYKFRHIGVATPGRLGVLSLESLRGQLQYHYSTCSKPLRSAGPWYDEIYRDWLINARSIMGELSVRRIPAPHERNIFRIVVPYSLLLSALLPIAIGAFNGFRFGLRSWIAYMTLLSVELAYFLPSAEWKWFW